MGEWAYEALFQAIDQPQGAEIAILVRLTWALWALPGLIFYLRGKKKLQEALRAAEEDSLDHSWEGLSQSEVTQTR